MPKSGRRIDPKKYPGLEQIRRFFSKLWGAETWLARDAVIAVSLVLVGIPLIISAAMPWWWFGAGFTAAGATLLWHTFSANLRGPDSRPGWVDWLAEPVRPFDNRWEIEFVPGRLLAEAAALVAIAAVTAGMAPELVLGERPISFDHPIHFTKAWRLEQEFLLDGRLRGWSHAWFAGYPAQYLYPIGADLLVVVVHALTFGFIELGTAYAWALAVFWTIRGWAIYRFASLGVGRWGGLLAAVLWMSDTAAARIGGWHFAMEVGVWPMSLAVALGVWATASLTKVATDGKPVHIAAFAALLGGAIWCHPFAVYHFAFVGPVALVAAWFGEDALPWLEATGRIVLGYLAGILVGLLWFLPFLTSTAEMDSNFGGTWQPMYEMGVSIYNAALFPGTWQWVSILGAVGIIACLVARRFHAILTGWIAFGFIVLASSDFLAAFHLLEFSEGLQTTHFKRFIAVVKPYWIVGAVYAVVGVVRLVGRRLERSHENRAGVAPASRRLQGAIGAFVFASAVAPIAVGFGYQFISNQMNRGLRTVEERPERQSRRALGSWFEAHHPGGPYQKGRFFRVAYCCGYHDHSFVDFGTRIEYPLYKIGFSPATSFEHRVKSGDRAVLDALNVRYMVSKRTLRRSYLQEVERFGSLHLYELKDWNEKPFEVILPDGPSAGSVGQSGIEVESFQPERVVLNVPKGAVPDGESKLRLNVSNFSRWEAWRGERALQITETGLKQDEKAGFITVPLEPGRYVFRFERSFLDWGAWLAGALGFAMILWLMLASVGGPGSSRWSKYAKLLATYQSRFQGYAGLIAMVSAAAIFIVAVGTASYAPPVDVEHVEVPSSAIRSVEFDAAEQISEASVGIRATGGFVQCNQIFGRFMCGSALWKQPHVRIEDFGFEYDRYRCIWSHPLPEGPIQFSFRDVPVAEGMVGWFGVAESGSQAKRRPVELTVAVDGVQRYAGKTVQDEALHGFELPLNRWAEDSRANVTFEVSAENTGMRHFCFNAQTAQFAGQGPSKTKTFVPDVPRASGLRP